MDKVTFLINHLAYSIPIDSKEFEEELLTYLPKDRNVDTKELLYAYIKKSREIFELKLELEQIAQKLPI